MKPIAPKTVLKIKKLWRNAFPQYKVGQIWHVGYYSKADGLDVVWLSPLTGDVDRWETADQTWVKKHFEVVKPSKEKSLYAPSINVDPPLFRVWKLGTDKSVDVNLEQLQKMLSYPTDRLTIAPLCSHPETFVDHGVRICKRCQEDLEVTSFRD